MKIKASCIFSIIITLLMSCMMPFSVAAEGGSLTAPFVGFNVHIVDIDPEYTQIDRGNYSITPGGIHITGQLNCSSWHNTSNDSACDIYELENQNNSTTAGLEFHLGAWSAKNLTNDEFVGTIYKRVYEVEFILDASYVGSVTFKDGSTSYTSYVNGTSFKQTFWTDAAASFSISITSYQLTRNTIGMWNFPIESFSAVNYLFDDNAYEITGLQDIPGYMYSYPIFKLPAKGYAARINPMSTTNEGYFIFAVDKDLDQSNFFDYFYFGQSEVSLKSVETVQPYGSGWGVYKVTVTKNGGTLSASIRPNVDMLLMPIYSGTSDNKFLGTEFALQFGLTNDFLDATTYGTQQSNQSAGNLDDSTDQMNTQMQDLIQTEDSYNQQFNNSLQNIDFTSPAGNQNLLSSANFVITVFNGLIQNNFLSTLIIIICILIIGKKVIGK